jgi:glycosyltransferase involved in cell wall biosynthesis
MKVLLCHGFYRQFGGEDQSFLDEAALLRSHGHHVVEYTRHNDEIVGASRVRVAANSIWNPSVYRELRTLVRRERPDVMHCTNIFPLISPSAHKAAFDEKVPVVQALHNYRLLCPSATLMRDGRVCGSCLGKTFAWPAIQHACYRGSRAGTAVVAAMLTVQKTKRAWRRVNRFFVPSHFARELFIRNGMPAARIDVKPNSVDLDLGPGQGDGDYALFVGRLSPEKGIDVLLEAWSKLPRNIPLRIIGDGPCRELVEQAAAKDPRITHLGHLSLREVYEQLQRAVCLVMPSVWYETFGRTIIEAYAAGTPVVASRLGAMEELVTHDETGLLFEPGNAFALSQAVCELFERNDPADLRRKARREFENNYTSKHNYLHLMNIYQRAIGKGCTVETAARHAVPYHEAAPLS